MFITFYHILSPFTIVDHRFLLNCFILFLDGGRFGLQGDLLVLGTLGVDSSTSCQHPTGQKSDFEELTHLSALYVVVGVID